MATISLCMIVKNEEAVLARCLDCLKGLVDEMIIVDTGSTDRTKEIARQYTKKVYDFVWNGNFSDARNFSFSKATMEYIYVADADEIIDKENQKRFWLLKQALLPEVEVVQMKYCNQLEFGSVYNFDEEYRGKMYRRLRTFRWTDPIHETVNLDPIVFDSDVEIIHKPLERHHRRDFKAFEKLTEQGTCFSKKMLDMYAKELFISGEEDDFIKAEKFFQQIFQEERTVDEYKVADCVLARASMLRGDVHRFFTVCLKEVADNPPGEICTLLGEYYKKCKEYPEAVMWYLNSIHEQACILDIRYGKEIPLKGIVECYESLGQYDLAKQYMEML